MKPNVRSVENSLMAAFFFRLAALFMLFGLNAFAFDPFMTNAKIAQETKNPSLLTATQPEQCKFSIPTNAVSLLEAIQRSLCVSPEVLNAWATVRGRAAQLGIADTSYLPTLTISGEAVPGFLKESVRASTPYTFNSHTETTGFSGDINWLLFDFGYRSANTEAAKQSLAASVAGLDAAIQKVIEDTASAYYEALAAQSTLEARNEALDTATESLAVATEKHRLGTTALSEKLQAETFYSKARLDRQKAVASLASMRGRLNVIMGIYVAREIRMEKANISASELAQALVPVEKMLEEAERQHPALRSANAALNAAKARVDAAKAADLPTVSLVANYSRNFQKGLFTEPYPATITQGTVGAKIVVPLSGYIERSYRVQTAKADELASRASLEKAKQDVVSGVWTSYQEVMLAKAEITSADVLLTCARQAYNAAKGRYRAGVGNMLEVMNTQSALADAEQQKISAVSGWFNAKLKLSASIGRLDLASIP